MRNIIWVMLFILSGCVHTNTFRAKDSLVKKSTLINKVDSIFVIETSESAIEIRSRSFNDYIHVGLFITPKNNSFKYSLNKAYIKSLANDVQYSVRELSSKFTYLCSKYPWKDQYYDLSVKSLEITKECPLRIDYTFDTSFKWSKIGSNVKDGFLFIDSGVGSSDVIEVEFN